MKNFKQLREEVDLISFLTFAKYKKLKLEFSGDSVTIYHGSKKIDTVFVRYSHNLEDMISKIMEAV